MSFIEFESAREKEKHRQELRDAREQMLKEAENRFHKREQRDREKILKGEADFLLPSVEKKLKKQSKSKKAKKEKKKKSKNKRKKHSSSDSDESSEEEKRKKKRKKKKYSSPSSSSSESSDESQDEWVEKSSAKPSEASQPLVRDSWMFDTTIATYSKEKKDPKKDEKKQIDSYDPAKSVKELNPYWKDGGGGLPSTFQKPKEDSDDEKSSNYKNKTPVQRGNWRKKEAVPEKSVEKPQKSPSRSPSRSKSSESDDEPPKKDESSMKNFLTDQQMNELGAKIVKAEIMGNETLAKQLKEKLELARECRKTVKIPPKTKETSTDNKKNDVQEIILTKSSTHGTSRPLEKADPYSRSGGKRKKQKPDTHLSGERVKYFPDDDKYDIKQMFEREKFTTSSDGDAQFTKIAMASSKAGSSRDNLEDIFASEAFKSMSDAKMSEKERARAINEHQKTTKILENCEMCIDSSKIEKQLIVALGEKVYLSLPWHEGLQPGHCLIATTAHLNCSTSVDEEIWSEINDFRKALTRMFAARRQDVIFFETVRYLHKNPHLVIHCVPSKNFEMAPFYFKKAIQESEREWSMNKQLIDLKKEKKDLRRAIPRGLPYFWVNFGMDEGFAHVIEEQERFPPNFAQEVIGGMLELDARAYRKPRREYNPVAKVKQFAEYWKNFDCTRD
ncbi:CWF19-like protein 2 homolog [Culicoides brevitarsis]|uniref:CWF19-like protein 2 homolog n=1 Tax=Culicoides brevitarsis TaxID=469753 RepID=UPI00307C71E0